MIESQITNRHPASVTQGGSREETLIQESLNREMARIHDKTLRGTLETYALKTHTSTALFTFLGATQLIIGAIFLAMSGKEKSSNNGPSVQVTRDAKQTEKDRRAGPLAPQP